MTPEVENRAAEARRLGENETLQAALAALRLAALENLGEIDPSNQSAIMAAQADIRAIANLRQAISGMIMAGSVQKHRPVA
jgi:hypothetical protein